MSKIFKWIVNIMFIIVIVVLATYFILRINDKVEIYNVKTGSMEDKIHAGDYILIYRKDEYQIGDVVTFIRNEGFITHRIIKIENGRVTTKGDANNTIDEDIPKSNILGKVIMVGGVLNVVVKYKYIFACIMLSLYLFSCYFGREKDGEENKESDDQKDIENLEIEEKSEDIEEKIEEKEETEIKEQEEIKKEIEEEPKEVLKEEKKEQSEEIGEVEEIIIKKKPKKKK